MAGRAKQGVTLPELIVSLLLFGLMGALGARALGALSGSGRGLARRVEVMEADRMLRTVLGEELRRAWGRADWDLAGENVLRVRSVRWSGWSCGAKRPPEEMGKGIWRWEGQLAVAAHRQPDPAKDSVLVLTADGRIIPGVLLDAGGGEGCPPDAGLRVVLRLAGPGGSPGPGAIPRFLRGFETREYMVAAGAFRLRRGLAGRQPLTAEVYGPGSAIRGGTSGILAVELHPAEGSGGGEPVRELSLFPPHR